MPADEVVHGRPDPAIGHVEDVDSGQSLEHFARKMGRRSRPAGSVAQFARPLFGERNQLRGARNRRDRHEIVQWIERHVRVYVRIDRDVAELNESDRVAVRRGFRDRLRAEISAAAGAIFNNDTLPQGFADILGGDARGDVHIVLRQGSARSAERRRRCDRRDGASITEPFHGHSPRQRHDLDAVSLRRIRSELGRRTPTAASAPADRKSRECAPRSWHRFRKSASCRRDR